MEIKSLNERYEIPYLSEWEHKDGGIYTALKVEHSFINNKNTAIVFYIKRLNPTESKQWADEGITNCFVRTVEHFKRSFKKVKE